MCSPTAQCLSRHMGGLCPVDLVQAMSNGHDLLCRLIEFGNLALLRHGWNFDFQRKKRSFGQRLDRGACQQQRNPLLRRRLVQMPDEVARVQLRFWADYVELADGEDRIVGTFEEPGSVVVSP